VVIGVLWLKLRLVMRCPFLVLEWREGERAAREWSEGEMKIEGTFRTLDGALNWRMPPET
jgi:hypothetical protein